METCSVFQEKFLSIIGEGVKSVLLENIEDGTSAFSPKESWESQNINNRSCSYCRVDFSDISVQREHYKLDWHRFNLKQSLLGKNPITENEFEERNGNDDISSISGSDSEKEDTLDSLASSQGKIFLQNASGQIFSLYKCLVFNKKDEVAVNEIAESLKLTCGNCKQWAVLMLGGGHFAGAIFLNDQPILHKTFHCYTVRQGQGSSQSSRDNKSGSSHPKSAGASLRRYNEQAFVQHVQGILEQWKNELGRCSRKFYRAPGPYNKSVLFGGSNPALQKSDYTLRTIPFPTRRATFAEVQRVYKVLGTVQLFGNLESAVEHLDKHRRPARDTKRTKTRSPQINRAKSREIIERPLPTKHSSETNSLADSETDKENKNSDPSISETDDKIELSVLEQEISFKYLQEYKSEKKVKKKKKPKKSENRILLDLDSKRKVQTKNLVATGNLEKLKVLFESIENSEEFADLDLVNEKKNNFVNEILDQNGNTLLHIAAMNGQVEIVQFLLENHANPCVTNKKLVVPFVCADGKQVKNAMKEFAREHPKMHNYNEARIPIDTLTPDQYAAMKKHQKQAKREKEKQKKEEMRLKKLEEVEKERFMKLSDREKRALAAERRILSQDGKIASRCFLCAADMSGKVPFEYLKNRFCSMVCLKAHRLQNPMLLS